MTQIQNPIIRASTSAETVEPFRVFGHWQIGGFGFVSGVGFRDSNLLSRWSEALPH